MLAELYEFPEPGKYQHIYINAFDQDARIGSCDQTSLRARNKNCLKKRCLTTVLFKLPRLKKDKVINNCADYQLSESTTCEVFCAARGVLDVYNSGSGTQSSRSGLHTVVIWQTFKLPAPSRPCGEISLTFGPPMHCIH